MNNDPVVYMREKTCKKKTTAIGIQTSGMHADVLHSDVSK